LAAYSKRYLRRFPPIIPPMSAMPVIPFFLKSLHMIEMKDSISLGKRLSFFSRGPPHSEDEEATVNLSYV
jgi:hypothetical protein